MVDDGGSVPAGAASGIDGLVRTVIENGYCIGCGVCAVGGESGLTIEVDEFGCHRPVRRGSREEASGRSVNPALVCPFADGVPNEDEIATARFAADCRHYPRIGYYQELYAGHVAEGDFREAGSSGGMGSWLLCELLGRNLVDAVIHVGPTADAASGTNLFGYTVSRSVAEVRARSKSRYYPVEMSAVLRSVVDTPGRYALVGLPCFVKAVRLLGLQNEVINERIEYCVGLVCGHLKSQEYARLLGWQLGIRPVDLRAIDFRSKMPGARASEYGVVATGIVEGVVTTRAAAASELFGSDWGLGVLKIRACDYCDDLFGETADVTIGDAWIRPYMADEKGNNIVIVRNARIRALIEDGRRSGRLHLQKMNCGGVIRSQRSALFHRWEALSYRLQVADERATWRPAKRVSSRHSLNERLQRKHRLRTELAERSHEAFRRAKERGDVSVFIDALRPLVEDYRRVERSPLRRVAAAVRGVLRRGAAAFAGPRR